MKSIIEHLLKYLVVAAVRLDIGNINASPQDPMTKHDFFFTAEC